MDRRYILLMLAGFVVLTGVLILIGLASVPKPQPRGEDEDAVAKYLSRKSDIVVSDPVLTLPDLDQNNDVVTFRTKQKDIIQNNRPLPLLPAERQTYESGLSGGSDAGVLKNLYKEKTRYYITNSHESTNRGAPFVDEGIRE